MKKKALILPILLILQILVVGAQVPDSITPEIKPVPNTLQFYVFGDWGRKSHALSTSSNVKNQVALAGVMDKVGAIILPDFIISTGDNFYPDGVKSVVDPRWKITFEDVYHGKYLQCRWYVVLGNHDHRGNVKAEIDYGKMHEHSRWYIPSNYYSEVMTTPDSATVKFIFIDTTPLLNGSDEQQLTWLTEQLNEGDYDWKFVVGHHPLYSGNWRTGEQANLRNAIENLMIKNKVDVYLCGHDHNLQYLKKGTIKYFVSGAGSEIYKSLPIAGMTQYIYCKEGRKCIAAFMILSVGKSGMIIQMVDANGQLIYKTQIQKDN